LEERQSRGLARTYAEKLTLRKSDFARKNEPGEKARSELAKTFPEKMQPILET
jgi:hypothetical protein